MPTENSVLGRDRAWLIVLDALIVSGVNSRTDHDQCRIALAQAYMRGEFRKEDFRRLSEFAPALWHEEENPASIYHRLPITLGELNCMFEKVAPVLADMKAKMAKRFNGLDRAP